MKRYYLIFPALVLAAAAATAVPGSAKQKYSKAVRERVDLMLSSKAALNELSDMMAGQVYFSSSRAGKARRQLIRNTKAIPKHFRKPYLDPTSNARTEIWSYWDDFKTRADSAEDAARDLNTRSLAGVRRTLPVLMQACLSCHETYRHEPKEFITH